MALPDLTTEQRMAALDKAAATRHARSELKKKVKKGEVSLESVLNSDDPVAKKMDELNISETRRVQGLGVRQREQLLEMLSK